MLYFKTKNERLIIKDRIDENTNVYWLITPGGDKSLYEYHISSICEKVWEKLIRQAVPNVLEDNPDDLNAYETAWKEKDEFDQEMADQDWMMAKAHEFYGTNKKL